MDQLKTINHIIDELDIIINRSIRENDFVGVFAYVYRRTTARIKEGILNDEFDDNERMEKFDVIFAKLYLEAYYKYINGEEPNYSWMACFEAREHNITIIQHILMGMNAHINLDLAIAAASISDKESLPGLKNDFMKVNNLLFSLIDEMQDRIGKVSRMMSIIDIIGGRKDEKLISSGIQKYRERAWDIAFRLVHTDANEQQAIISTIDKETAVRSIDIQFPSNTLLKIAFWITSRFEEKNIKTIIDKLKEIDVQEFEKTKSPVK